MNVIIKFTHICNAFKGEYCDWWDKTIECIELRVILFLLIVTLLYTFIILHYIWVQVPQCFVSECNKRNDISLFPILLFSKFTNLQVQRILLKFHFFSSFVIFISTPRKEEQQKCQKLKKPLFLASTPQKSSLKASFPNSQNPISFERKSSCTNNGVFLIIVNR